jgi:hypothetical protein
MLQEETRKRLARYVVIYFFSLCVILFGWQLLAMALGYDTLKPSYLFDWLTNHVCLPTFHWAGTQIAASARFFVSGLQTIWVWIGECFSWIIRIPGRILNLMNEFLSWIWTVIIQPVLTWLSECWLVVWSWVTNLWTFVWLSILKPTFIWIYDQCKALFLALFEFAKNVGTYLLQKLDVWFTWIEMTTIRFARWVWSSVILYTIDLLDLMGLWIIKQCEWLGRLIVAKFHSWVLGSWVSLKNWAWFAYRLATEIYLFMWELVIAIMEMSKFNLAARAVSELVVSSWRLITSWVSSFHFFSVTMEGYFTQKTLSVALSVCFGIAAVALFFLA